jgi:hypothetical protein
MEVPCRQIPFFILRLGVFHSTLKENPNSVYTGFQFILDIKLIAVEHVVGVPNQLVVDPNGRQGVQTMADKINPVLREKCVVDHEVSGIFPVGLSHPICVEFLSAIERIFDEPGIKEVCMDAARNDGRDGLGVLLSLFHGPAAVQVD